VSAAGFSARNIINPISSFYNKGYLAVILKKGEITPLIKDFWQLYNMRDIVQIIL